MKVRKRKLVTDRLLFDFSSGDQSAQIDFHARTPSKVHAHFDCEVSESGFFRIHRPASGKERIEFIVAPNLDLVGVIGENEYVRELGKLQDLGVNCLRIETKEGSIGHQFDLLIEPNEIDEEGWFFAFTEGPHRDLLGNTSTLSATTIIETLLVSDTLSVSLVSWRGGIAFEVMAITFPYLDDFRSHFSSVFGERTVAEIIRRRGYEIEPD